MIRSGALSNRLSTNGTMQSRNCVVRLATGQFGTGLGGSQMAPPVLSVLAGAFLHLRLLLFLFAYIPIQSMCSDEHLVFAGACNKESPTFCDGIVRNSVCNRAKNECFCRKGFVAVKEGDSVACKTCRCLPFRFSFSVTSSKRFMYCTLMCFC